MPQRRKKAAPHRVKKAVTSKRNVKAKKVAKKAEKIVTKVKVNELSVYDLSGKSVSTLTLDPLFHEGAVNTDILHQAIVMYQAGQREGTAATKTRGEVSGGGKKPWKQKGTGRARHASIRSPIWTGGGTVFGPHPRDYSYAIPREMRRRAVVEGVKYMATNGKLTILKDLTLDKPKTQGMVKILETFKTVKPLFLVDKKNDNVMLASRNIKGVAIKTAEEVNALDVASHKECLMTQSAYNGLLKRLKK